jgi:hypothetical protein
MKISELISKLQQLNHDHWAAMKQVTPMGHQIPEPDIYVEQWDGVEGFQGFTKEIDVILDLGTGVQIIPLL